MSPRLLLAGATAAALSVAPAALACAPVTATDRATGETYSSGSPAWFRHEQADWRARSDVVLLAQARAGRMAPNNEIEFTLVPVAALYDGDLPATDLPYRWNPGHSCNTFALTIGDIVVVYANRDGTVVGLTVPEQQQDRTPEFRRRIREIRRGLIGQPIRE